MLYKAKSLLKHKSEKGDGKVDKEDVRFILEALLLLFMIVFIGLGSVMSLKLILGGM